MNEPPRPPAGWTPSFPAERLRAAGDSIGAIVACDGRDRHRLTMTLAQAAGIGLTGLALIVLDVYLHVFNRGFGVGIGLALVPAVVFLSDRWVDGPVLYYRRWGRLRQLQLTGVTAVAARSRAGGVALLLSAPGLRRPLRIGVRSRGYVMSPGARDHVHGWLSGPQVHWTPQAEALLEEHGSDVTLTARRRHGLLAKILAYGLPLAVVAVGAWAVYRHNSARAIPGAPGYRTFGGPHGKPLTLGRPWGRACQPIRFAVERHVSDSTYDQIATVVGEARRDGLDVTLESRAFTWSPGSLYYVDGQSPAATVRVGIFARTGRPPRLANGQLEHINLGWDAQLDHDGHHEDLAVADGDLWTQTVGHDPLALRRSIRQLIAMTQGIIKTTRSDSGIASDSRIDRFTPADIAAMKRMSGCSQT